MALFSPSNTFSQRGVGDLGRCGLPFDYQPASVSAAEAAAQAGLRLLTAATMGDSLAVMRCVADGADPNFVDSSTGETPLHRAAQRNQPSLVQVLASLGAHLDAPDRAGRTALYMAASGGFIAVVEELLSLGASLFPTTTDSSPRRPTSPHPSHQTTAEQAPPTTTAPTSVNGRDHGDDDEALLALRTTCPLAAAAAAGRWPVVAALLAALPRDYERRPPALRALRFLVWALASHKAFPREVISRLPPRLPRCVIDAVRPAHLASTPLVLATGNDQQQLMQWLLQQGADPELGAPLLLCAGRFCRGSRTCCVSTLLRRGAAPHVAWADNPADSPLRLAAAGDCFTHVHCLVAYGADAGAEAARVREALYAPAPWEAHLDALMQQYGALAAAPGADMLCPCGQQHAVWPGLWPQDAEGGTEAAEAAAVQGPPEAEESAPAAPEAGAGGNSCHNQTPADDAWYRHHRAEMEQLQDGQELAECRKVVDELWRYGCSAVVSELGGEPAAPHCLMPQRVLAAMQDVAGGWLLAAARCRQQRQLRVNLYDKAVAAGRVLLDRKRIAALAALSGGCGGACVHSNINGGSAVTCSSGSTACSNGSEEQPVAAAVAVAVAPAEGDGVCRLPQQPQQQRSLRPHHGLVSELRMEVLALAGLAPPGVELRALSGLSRAACGCLGCRSG